MKTHKEIFYGIAHTFGYWLGVRRKKGEDRRYRYLTFADGMIVASLNVLREHMPSNKQRRRDLGRTIAAAIKGGQT